MVGIPIETNGGKIYTSEKSMCSYSKHGSFFNVECFFFDEDVDDGKDKQERRRDLYT